MIEKLSFYLFIQHQSWDHRGESVQIKALQPSNGRKIQDSIINQDDDSNYSPELETAKVQLGIWIVSFTILFDDC